MEFEEVTELLKINHVNNENAYVFANKFLEELVSSNDKLQVYEKIIKSI